VFTDRRDVLLLLVAGEVLLEDDEEDEDEKSQRFTKNGMKRKTWISRPSLMIMMSS
jgi:cobalamin biosynthesis Co2+ chelatase CbiK